MGKIAFFVFGWVLNGVLWAHANHDHGDEGEAASSAASSQAAQENTITVVARDDMTFTFSAPLEFKAGDKVLFDVTNQGKKTHQFSIGSPEQQAARLRPADNTAEGEQNAPGSITLQPGERETLVWQFEAPGIAIIACNEPGHFQAGMWAKATIAQ